MQSEVLLASTVQGVCLPRFQNLTDPLHSELHAGAESHVSLSHSTELSDKIPPAPGPSGHLCWKGGLSDFWFRVSHLTVKSSPAEVSSSTGCMWCWPGGSSRLPQPLTPFQQVSEWPSTHLESTNKKNSCHSQWPRGPECHLVEDTAAGTPAPQVGYSVTREVLGDICQELLNRAGWQTE